MWLAILLFIVIPGLLAYLDTRKPKNYSPRPVWLPIIGSALTIAELRKNSGYLYISTAEIPKKYGPGSRAKNWKRLISDSLRPTATSDDLSGRPTGAFSEIRTWGKRLSIMLNDSNS